MTFTGPEHYLLAQNALSTALIDGIPADAATRMQLDGIGHAILALAAAVGTHGPLGEPRSREDSAEWERVAGEFTRQAPIRREYEARERAEHEAERQAAKDAEDAADAWSTAEQFEHDQACEAAIDATDAERWANEDGGKF